jgi:hypothetical protein
MSENPYRPLDAVEPSEVPDFQDLDDKPWLRTASREPLIGYRLGLAIFVVLGLCAIAACGYFFGRRGVSISAFIFATLLAKASRR